MEESTKELSDMLRTMKESEDTLAEWQERGERVGVDLAGEISKNTERAREIAQRTSLATLTVRLLDELKELARTRTKQWIEASGVTAEEIEHLYLAARLDPDVAWQELLGGEDWFNGTGRLLGGVMDAWAEAIPDDDPA